MAGFNVYDAIKQTLVYMRRAAEGANRESLDRGAEMIRNYASGQEHDFQRVLEARIEESYRIFGDSCLRHADDLSS